MKDLLVVGALLAAILSASCSKAQKAAPSPKRQDWVVLPEKEAMVLKRPCSRSFPPDLVGYWTLGDADVQRAETRVQDALRAVLRRLPNNEREDSPGLWYAQYAGFFRNGRKVVYVNAVGAGVADDMWRDRAVTICDGGLLSFGAVLDLETDTVDSFEFNGTIAGPIRIPETPARDAAGER